MRTPGEIKTSHLIMLALVGAVVFFGALFLRPHELYISPDETANAFFAEQFARAGTLSVFDPLSVAFEDRLHPRSVVSLDGHLVPVSFVGLPVLYGSLMRAIGDWSLPLATPALALFAMCAWYALMRRIFEDHIALVSALLLAMHPGWWYYSARGLMHNVLFASLLVFCAYFLIVRPVRGLCQRNKRLALLKDFDWVLGGLMLGLAFFVRASEVGWIAIVFLLVGVWLRRELSIRGVFLFALSCVLAISPMLFLNRATYGHPLATGYTAQEAEIISFDVVANIETETGSEQEFVEMSMFPLLPFGIDLRAAAKHTLQYGLGLFWWMGLLALIGIPLLYPKRSSRLRERSAQKLFFVVAVLVSAWLAIMYGSWTIFDNPDVTSVTIANSYVRYWLPLYALMTPFAAYGIFWVADRGRTDVAKRLIAAILIFASMGLSINAVFFQAEDGLLAVTHTLERSAEIKQSVLTTTEQNAVIIVDRGDKLFFPDRRVLYPLRDESTYELMPRIERRAPLYYYGVTFPEQDMTYLNTLKLKELGLQIELLATFDQESLYRIFSP